MIPIQSGRTEAKVSEVGGTVTRFIVAGQDIFYPWRRVGEKTRGGCPICAPWFGSSPRGDKKHGFLRDTRTRDYHRPDKNVAEFKFDRAGPDGRYPWPLEYAVQALVQHRILSIELEITRKTDTISGRAPVLPGFHPFFACEDANKVEVRMADKIFKGFANKSKVVPLENTEFSVRLSPTRIVRMRFNIGTSLLKPQLVFWTDSPNKYICAEPVLYDPEFFDTARGRSLDKNESIRVGLTFEVLSL